MYSNKILSMITTLRGGCAQIYKAGELFIKTTYMYTTIGEKLTWAEFEARRESGEELFVGEYPIEDKKQFKQFAHTHTKAETEKWLKENDMSLDIMYTKGRPDCYDKWSGECAGIHCTDGYLWN